jgi:enterochelin esterase family protein
MQQLQQRTLLTLLIVLFSFASSCTEQELATVNSKNLSVLQKLDSIAALESEQERIEATSSFWNAMKNENNIPFTEDSLAVFFYHGPAQKVNWNGDFNSWSQDKDFDNEGINIAETNLWYWSAKFPKDARLDYKITLNGSSWILDPENQYQQWSGFGPNSELRMPEYKPEDALVSNSDIPTGVVKSYKIYSDQLKYDVAYQVYLPSDYENLNNLPIIYVTDGHEYSNEKLGNMITVVNNLIEQDFIKPIMVIFIDPRNPNNLNSNRRQDEYTVSKHYLDFVTNELGSKIDSQFKTAATPSQRAILGTSLGGINSSYFGAEAYHYFRNIAIQSPAYWYRASEIYDIVQQAEHNESRIFMTAGTFNDGLTNSQKMQEIYTAKGVDVELMTVNEGHSWGAWSAQLDDILIYFYGSD